MQPSVCVCLHLHRHHSSLGCSWTCGGWTPTSRYMCDSGEERGICNQAHVFAHVLFASHKGADITMKEFSAFLDMRRCKNRAPKISS